MAASTNSRPAAPPSEGAPATLQPPPPPPALAPPDDPALGGAAAAAGPGRTAGAAAARARRGDRERAVEAVAHRAHPAALALAVVGDAAVGGAPAVGAGAAEGVGGIARRQARALGADLTAAGGVGAVDIGVARRLRVGAAGREKGRRARREQPNESSRVRSFGNNLSLVRGGH